MSTLHGPIYTEDDKGETTTEAESEVEVTQQRDVTKKPLQLVIYCNYMQLHMMQSLMYTIAYIYLSDLIECNLKQNLKQAKLTDYFKSELNQLS